MAGSSIRRGCMFGCGGPQAEGDASVQESDFPASAGISHIWARLRPTLGVQHDGQAGAVVPPGVGVGAESGTRNPDYPVRHAGCSSGFTVLVVQVECRASAGSGQQLGHRDSAAAAPLGLGEEFFGGQAANTFLARATCPHSPPDRREHLHTMLAQARRPHDMTRKRHRESRVRGRRSRCWDASYQRHRSGGRRFWGLGLIVAAMNSLIAHLLAAILADAAGQLAGTAAPGAQPTVADRALECGCATGSGLL